jgi:hypothetical protein
VSDGVFGGFDLAALLGCHTFVYLFIIHVTMALLSW